MVVEGHRGWGFAVGPAQTDRLTDTTENIAFSQIHWRVILNRQNTFLLLNILCIMFLKYIQKLHLSGFWRRIIAFEPLGQTEDKDWK